MAHLICVGELAAQGLPERVVVAVSACGQEPGPQGALLDCLRSEPRLDRERQSLLHQLARRQGRGRELQLREASRSGEEAWQQ